MSAATYTVLRDVSESLRLVLRERLGEDLENDDSIELRSPAEIKNPGARKLSLYLFKMDRNPHMRNMPPTRLPAGESAERQRQIRRPPMVMDLLYMITAFTQDAVDELMLHEKLLTTFYDYPVLRNERLYNSLASTGNTFLRIIPIELPLDDQSKLWSSFTNTAFKLATFVMVTPVKIPSALPPRDYTPIREEGVAADVGRI